VNIFVFCCIFPFFGGRGEESSCAPSRIIPDPPKAVAEGQRVAAAVDLTGQAHAMAEFKAGRVWPRDGIDSDSQTLHGFVS